MWLLPNVNWIDLNMKYGPCIPEYTINPGSFHWEILYPTIVGYDLHSKSKAQFHIL
jgi:hypothetical protein